MSEQTAQIGHNRPPPPRAIIRHDEKNRYIVVLCPRGHFIESHKLTKFYGGSRLAADLAGRHPGDRFDRLAAQCTGHGCNGH